MNNLNFRVFRVVAPGELSHSAPTAARDERGDAPDPNVRPYACERELWSIAFQRGYGLDARIALTPDSGANDVYSVRARDGRGETLCVCLDAEIEQATLARLSAETCDTFVCRAGALTDEGAAELARRIRLEMI